MKQKAVVDTGLSENERRLCVFFYVVAGLGLLALLANFFPFFNVSWDNGIGIDSPNAWNAYFSANKYYASNVFGILADVMIAVAAILALVYAITIQTQMRWRSKNTLVYVSVGLNLVAAGFLYGSSIWFSYKNTLSDLGQVSTFAWGFIVSGGLVLAAMFIEWFFVNRLNGDGQ